MLNYGQRGRRGFKGRSVNSIQIDSEGVMTAYYSEAPLEEIVGKIPMGMPGPAGENGRIIDVIVNGESTVDSEGKAYITIGSEGPTYVAGDNITIENDVISAIDTVYTAGENITIDGTVINAIDTTYTAGENIVIDSENVISANIDDILGQDLLVNIDVGGYYAGDVIEGTTTLRDIIKHLLQKEVPPTPPVQDTWYWWASNDIPTEIADSASSKAIDAQEVAREGMVQYFTTNRQYATVAYPASMGNLTHIIESDMFDVLSAN